MDKEKIMQAIQFHCNTKATTWRGLLRAYNCTNNWNKKQIAKSLISTKTERPPYGDTIKYTSWLLNRKASSIKARFGLFPPAHVTATPAGKVARKNTMGIIGTRQYRIIKHAYRQYFAAAGQCLAVPAETWKLSGSYPYKVSQSSWAGGDHSTTIELTTNPYEIRCSGGSYKVWSSNNKWSGNNSYASLTATERTICHLGDILYNGLLHLDAEPVGRREYRAVWCEQARGFDLKKVDGWIIKGHHIKGGTLKMALKKAQEARKKAITAAIRQRQSLHERFGLKHIWVSVDDSLKAGNCRPATETMRAKIVRTLGGEVGAIRADVLLNLQDDFYTRRAVATAAARQAAL